MTATLCPCCGSSVEADLPMLEATTRVASYGDRQVRLPPSSANMLACLLAASPRAARQGALMTALWGFGNEPEEHLQTFRTQVSFLRRSLRQIGWTVVNVYGDGYQLRVLP